MTRAERKATRKQTQYPTRNDMKTYIIQETEKLIRYTTVQASSKAEALRFAEDGDLTMCDIGGNIIGGGVTYKAVHCSSPSYGARVLYELENGHAPLKPFN